MKADYRNTSNTVVMLILALVVGLVMFYWVQGGNASASSYQAPKENVACKKNSDCTTGLCLTINNQPSFCGCLDDADCGCMNCCKNNKCSV